MKYVYLESGINIVRVLEEEYLSKNIKSVEVLVFDSLDHYHFEYNDIAQSIYESENLETFDTYNSPEETEVYQKFILPLIGANKCTGLEAIQEYKRVTCSNCQYKDRENCNVVCFSNIIEKELKEYEQLKEMYNHALEVNSKLSESIINYKKELKDYKRLIEIISRYIKLDDNYDEMNSGSTKAFKVCIPNCISVEEDDDYTDDCYPNDDYDFINELLKEELE